MHSSILCIILAVSGGGILGNLLLHRTRIRCLSISGFFFFFFFFLNNDLILWTEWCFLPLTLKNIFVVISGQAMWLVGFF